MLLLSSVLPSAVKLMVQVNRLNGTMSFHMVKTETCLYEWNQYRNTELQICIDDLKESKNFFLLQHCKFCYTHMNSSETCRSLSPIKITFKLGRKLAFCLFIFNMHWIVFGMWQLVFYKMISESDWAQRADQLDEACPKQKLLPGVRKHLPAVLHNSTLDLVY